MYTYVYSLQEFLPCGMIMLSPRAIDSLVNNCTFQTLETSFQVVGQRSTRESQNSIVALGVFPEMEG